MTNNLPNDKIEYLLTQARHAAGRAYAPYSNFHVGAALLTEDGELFTGANVENASYSLTICAERSALACAISAGARRFTALALFSPDAEETLYPCGACLQTLAEFASDLPIYTQTPAGQTTQTTLKKLLPKHFNHPKNK